MYTSSWISWENSPAQYRSVSSLALSSILSNTRVYVQLARASLPKIFDGKNCIPEFPLLLVFQRTTWAKIWVWEKALLSKLSRFWGTAKCTCSGPEYLHRLPFRCIWTASLHPSCAKYFHRRQMSLSSLRRSESILLKEIKRENLWASNLEEAASRRD